MCWGGYCTLLGPLRPAGLVRGNSGAGNGFCLTQPAADINLLDVVKAVGWSIQLELPPVPVKGGVELHRRLQAACDDAAEAGRAALRGVSLADLLNGEGG